MDQPSRLVATVAGTLLLALALEGCATPRPTEQSLVASGSSGVTTGGADGDYRLQRGDGLEIKFFTTPELNEAVTVRPDGRITLQVVGEVEAAGLTSRGLADALKERYRSTLLRPEIAVIVKKFAGLRAYVGGEVASPGILSFESPTTLLQALMQAGWLKKTAEPRNVVILRDRGADVPEVLFVDVKALIEQPGSHRAVPLQPYDIVYVPMSTVAKVGDFVDQYLDKILLTPISRIASFGFVYQFNRIVQ
jgi:protein involved in polysaccharide export with SLBB domain